MKKKTPARKPSARKPQKPLKKAKGKGKASTTVKKAPPKAVVKPKGKAPPKIKKAPPKPKGKAKTTTVKKKTPTVKKVVKSKPKVAEVPKATAAPWKEEFVIRTQNGQEVDRKDDLIVALQTARLTKGRVAVYKTAPKGGKEVMMSFTGYGRWKGYEDYSFDN